MIAALCSRRKNAKARPAFLFRPLQMKARNIVAIVPPERKPAQRGRTASRFMRETGQQA
jgi:hypothetical protein